MIVVKVGGSLFDLPDLGPRLRAFLASLADEDRLLVPGGGSLTTLTLLICGCERTSLMASSGGRLSRLRTAMASPPGC